MTRRTPARPRSTSARRKPAQALPSSLPAASSSPRIRRSPVAATPTATSAAMLTTSSGVADLDVRRVEEEVRIALLGKRAMAERVDLGVEGSADPADLAPGEVGDPERLDEVLHPAGADAGHVGLLDDRQEGPLGPPTGLEEGWEVGAIANLGDRQADRADPGVP